MNTLPQLYSFSQVSTFNTCNRKHYLSYIRRWRSDTDAPALAFGGAWGKAMDTVWEMAAGWSETVQAQNHDMILTRALDAFIDSWISRGMPHPSDMDLDTTQSLLPRTPGVARDMLSHYLSTRARFFSEIELLSIEEPFVIPLSPGDTTRFYVGLMDKVYRWGRDNRVYTCDHKTSSAYAKVGYFRSTFLEGFNPNAQMDGYQYALQYLYGDEAKHIMVDAALVHKTVHDGFRFIPVYPSPDLLNSWLWELHHAIDKKEHEEEQLAIGLDLDTPVEKRQPVPFMQAFPRNTSSCHHYNGCQFLDVCKAVSDPRKVKQPPPGFIEDTTTTAERLGISIEKLQRAIDNPVGALP